MPTVQYWATARSTYMMSQPSKQPTLNLFT